MKLIKDSSQLKKQILPKPLTHEEVESISTTLLTELTKHGGIGSVSYTHLRAHET